MKYTILFDNSYDENIDAGLSRENSSSFNSAGNTKIRNKNSRILSSSSSNKK